MRIVGVGIAVVVAACMGVVGVAQAQVSTKGAGKSSVSIIKFPVANIQAKAAGTMSAKPSASVVGKPPTGGILSSLKLAKDIGDPAKPGFAPGNYVLDIETAATPDGDVQTLGVAFFITLTVDGAFKCTVQPAETVDGDGTGDTCTPGPPNLCAPAAVGKCNFTVYQAAGIPNFSMIADGSPQGTRVRIRNLTNPGSCATGDLLLLGVPQPPSSDCRNAANTVVGIIGVAAGDVSP